LVRKAERGAEKERLACPVQGVTKEFGSLELWSAVVQWMLIFSLATGEVRTEPVASVGQCKTVAEQVCSALLPKDDPIGVSLYSASCVSPDGNPASTVFLFCGSRDEQVGKPLRTLKVMRCHGAN
jgi:hypothetical protein